MLSIGIEGTSFKDDAAHFFVLRGRVEILRLRTVLTNLCTLCGQGGAMDYLEYFLTTVENLKKTPYLVLIASRSDVGVLELRAEDLRGAVLLYEYRVMGFGSRLFTTCDFDGRRADMAVSGAPVGDWPAGGVHPHRMAGPGKAHRTDLAGADRRGDLRPQRGRRNHCAMSIEIACSE